MVVDNMSDLKKKILQGTSKSLETIGIDKLKKVIRMSQEEKREHGLLFCGDTDIPPFGNISHSDLCVGTECSVIMKDCKGKIQIGTFHTHPDIKPANKPTLGHLSGSDIYSSIFNRRRFSCIGLTEGDKPTIKCFIPEFDIDAITTFKLFMAQDNYNRKLSEYNLSEQKPDGTKKRLEELLGELPRDKKTILSNIYDTYLQADGEFHEHAEHLAKKLISKDADLVIK